MNTGQTIITLGAFMLLSYAILNFNKMLSYSDISLAQNRYRLEALSMMTSYVEQSSQYFYDEASTDTNNTKTLAEFTAPAQLGFEANDNGVVDDFDDFNNHTVIDTGISGIPYRLNFTVDYVTLSNGHLINSGQRQYYKRMNIKIMDNFSTPILYKESKGKTVRDTLELTFVNTYWFYD